MIVLLQASVLTVGLDDRNEALSELPIRLITMRSGLEAARSLKTEEVESVISKWDLEDMADGMFLARLKAAKPDIPTIAFIEAGNKDQEIAARSLGITAVLSNRADDELFQQTVANVLGLTDTASIRRITPARKRIPGRERISR